MHSKYFPVKVVYKGITMGQSMGLCGRGTLRSKMEVSASSRMSSMLKGLNVDKGAQFLEHHDGVIKARWKTRDKQ